MTYGPIQIRWHIFTLCRLDGQCNIFAECTLNSVMMFLHCRIFFYDENNTEVHFTVKLAENYDANPFDLTLEFRDMLRSNYSACNAFKLSPSLYPLNAFYSYSHG